MLGWRFAVGAKPINVSLKSKEKVPKTGLSEMVSAREKLLALTVERSRCLERSAEIRVLIGILVNPMVGLTAMTCCVGPSI